MVLSRFPTLPLSHNYQRGRDGEREWRQVYFENGFKSGGMKEN
jgi:hypothetical protein